MNLRAGDREGDVEHEFMYKTMNLLSLGVSS